MHNIAFCIIGYKIYFLDYKNVNIILWLTIIFEYSDTIIKYKTCCRNLLNRKKNVVSKIHQDSFNRAKVCSIVLLIYGKKEKNIMSTQTIC